ncbi:MAG: LysR family transcriptional regulator [Beutenbergiaceae bacterium]
MLSADYLPVFLAVARTGRLVRAAEELRVDHTTVGRQITALERAMGHRLFDRTPSGWRLTNVGQSLIAPAEAVERALLQVREVADTGRSGLTGSVRILCPDGFGAFLFTPALGQVRRDHPDLIVEVVTSTSRLEQVVRDFDIAVTLEQPTSPKAVTRPLMSYHLGLYAARSYLQQCAPITAVADLAEHTVIWYIDQLLDVRPLHDMDGVLARPADIQSTNVVAHWQGIRAGYGVGPLPDYIGDTDEQLVRVLPEVRSRQTYWVVIPRPHQRLARVNVLVEVLDAIAAEHAPSADA